LLEGVAVQDTLPLGRIWSQDRDAGFSKHHTGITHDFQPSRSDVALVAVELGILAQMLR
jgi:hypothetical protein